MNPSRRAGLTSLEDRGPRAAHSDASLMLVAQPGSSVTLRRALRGAGSDAWGYGPKRVVLAIGPEGDGATTSLRS